MRITDALLGEHGVFYAQFNACEELIETADADAVRRAAALIASALKPHAQLEDELLFDPLVERADRELDIFPLMEQEHAMIADLLDQIQRTRTVVEARELLLEAIDLARVHFMKEERIAFPRAEQELDETELLRLGRQWSERRGVTLDSSLPVSGIR